MPKRSSKRQDISTLAFKIVSETIGEKQPSAVETKGPEKNPAAVALGRLGGLKGGKARAKSLSVKKRKEIARKAAKTRWKKTE